MGLSLILYTGQAAFSESQDLWSGYHAFRNQDVDVYHAGNNFIVTCHLDRLVKTVPDDASQIRYLRVFIAKARRTDYGFWWHIGVGPHGERRPSTGAVDNDVHAKIIGIIAPALGVQFGVDELGAGVEDRRCFYHQRLTGWTCPGSRRDECQEKNNAGNDPTPPKNLSLKHTPPFTSRLLEVIL
jgi:hypothetical protein